MIRDITIGQYYAADSKIHKLDPRVKLAGTMLYIISLFTADGPICYLLAVFALAAVIHLSTVPFKFMARFSAVIWEMPMLPAPSTSARQTTKGTQLPM